MTIADSRPELIPTCFDVIVVGSGAAGLYASLCLPSEYRVGLVSKDKLQKGASDWAQGGIAAAIDPQDSPNFHYEDTLKAGAGLCDPQAVRYLVDHASVAIDGLVRLGVDFDRQDHHLAMTLEAAHSHARVLHSADQTGRAIVSILQEQVLSRSNIQVLPQTLAIDVFVENGRCRGVYLLFGHQLRLVRAKAVILATGGGGQVFSQTTNPAVSTGDGVAMAWRCGALLRDLEFFQFHPTALIHPDAPRFLISEAVRGEGAHLVNPQGKRFVFDYDQRGELAPRDIVSRAIYQYLESTGESHVYLDLRSIPVDRLQYRFPNIIQFCQRFGIDVFSTPIPVAPAAHYWMGGVAVNLENETSIAGLYAIGETASTGVHGANRLASNSLLECIVYAQQLSHLVLPLFSENTDAREVTIEKNKKWDKELHKLQQIRHQLPQLVWHSAGICRQGSILEQGVDRITQWQREVSQMSLPQLLQNPEKQPMDLMMTQAVITEQWQSDLRQVVETINLLDIAYLIVKSSLFREESRGGHYRSDYPLSSTAWQKHTITHSHHWGLR